MSAMYLRAVATYTDRRGGSKLAEFVSDYPVQEAREINTDPEFRFCDCDEKR